MAYRVLSKEERSEADRILQFFGFEVSGGSFSTETNRYCIGINKRGAATYDEPKVAALLMKILGGESIELDSKVFPKQKT